MGQRQKQRNITHTHSHTLTHDTTCFYTTDSISPINLFWAFTRFPGRAEPESLLAARSLGCVRASQGETLLFPTSDLFVVFGLT